jgi:Uncharacterized protein conserved in bacteria (DUF2255)
VHHEGHIRAGGVNDEIDAAYRSKYRRYAASIIGAVVSPQARSATIEIVPRSTTSYSSRVLRAAAQVGSTWLSRTATLKLAKLSSLRASAIWENASAVTVIT